jgi:hypothetical protein
MCVLQPAQPCSCDPDWLLVFEALAALVDRWRLGEGELATLLGTARRGLPRRPARLTPRLLRRALALVQIDVLLRQLIPDEQIAFWLRRGNPGLRWHPPLDLMLAVPRWIPTIRSQLMWEIGG